MIFWREPTSILKSETNLIIILNKSLQKARVLVYTQFNKVEYLQSKVISTLVTEKWNTENLVKNHSNILIRAAKLINNKVICVETLKYWQRLKVYKMFLVWYLGDRKKEFLH